MAEDIDLDEVRAVFARAFVEEGQFAEDRVAAVIAQTEFTITTLPNGEIEISVRGMDISTGFDGPPDVDEIHGWARSVGALDADNFIWTLNMTGEDPDWPTPLNMWPIAPTPPQSPGPVFSIPPDDEFESD